MSPYPHLFSEWQIRNTTVKNRVVFPPTCPSFVSDPCNALFTDMATAYYREPRLTNTGAPSGTRAVS